MDIEKIAIESGCSVSTIRNIIAGRRRPSWDLAKRIAEAAGIKPDVLLDGTPEEINSALNGGDA